MMEIEQPVTTIPIRRTDWLDRPLASLVTLDRATLILGVILLLTIVSRFWDLGSRALHHDESLHAVYSYYLYDQGRYIHEPLMHGPVLFHLTALGYWLFGDSDFTARLWPAILGVVMAWLPWKYRSWLGEKGALFTSFLVLISPSILYYSRFIREDIFALTWTAIIVYGLYKYLEGGEDFHLYAMTAGWALLFSQKEISFLFAFIFWTFLALVLLLRRIGRLGPRVPLREAREWHLLVLLGALLLPHATALVLHLPTRLNEALGLALPNLDPGTVGGNSETSVFNSAATWPTAYKIRGYLTALLLGLAGFGLAARLWSWRKFLVVLTIFYTIFLLFHTTFLTNLHGVGSGMIGALGYWIEQHEVQRGEQPWYYYSMLLPLYEFLPLLLGLGGAAIVLARRRNGTISPEAGEPHHLNTRALWPWFNLWWFFGAFVIFSYAGEKMPWLLVHMAFPVITLAGWAMGKFLDNVEWERLRGGNALWFTLLFLVAAVAVLNLVWMALTGQSPFGGGGSLQSTARWVMALLFLLGAGWGALHLRDQIGGSAAGKAVVLALTVILALATVRYAVIASFINADTPNEPLIFVQTSPMMTMLADDLAAISERIAGGKNIRVAYDNFSSWPFEWYLRDYPNRFFYSDQPQTYADSIRGAPVVLVGHANEQAVKPFVNGYVRHEYPMRWWFPEEYKEGLRLLSAQPDANNPGQNVINVGEESKSPITLMRNIALLWQQPQYRRDFFDFVLNREMKEPLGGENLIVYIQPEVAAEVWQYGVEVAAPTTASSAPSAPASSFADAVVQLPATTIVGQPGEFLSPKNVAVLPDGNLAVADTGNHRIRVMQPDGTLVSEFGSFGTGEGQFNEPWGVAAAPDGTLFVADTWNHRIQHLTTEGEVLHVWGTFAETGGVLGDGGTFWGPRDVAVDSEGNVYVTDTGNKRVQKFDAEGNFLDQFGGAGAGPGQLAEPVGVAVSPDGTIWVADTWNRRVQSFSPDFTPLAQIPVDAWAGENLTNKPYIAASDERVWITDPEGYRVVEFDPTGEVQRVWGQFGSDESGVNLPFGLAWDATTNSLWVADSENHRVLGYDIE